MLHMKQLNSKKTRFPRFDKILAEVYGEGNERQLCWEIAQDHDQLSFISASEATTIRDL